MSPAGNETMPGGTTGGTPGILLAHHLKQLKLPTVLREYDKVAPGMPLRMPLQHALRAGASGMLRPGRH